MTAPQHRDMKHTVLLERVDKTGAVLVKMLLAERLNALQGPFTLLGEGLCRLEHRLRVARIVRGSLALFHDVPEGSDDELGDNIHLKGSAGSAVNTARFARERERRETDVASIGHDHLCTLRSVRLLLVVGGWFAVRGQQ